MVSYIRHRLTEYDRLLDEGYDQESARFFVLEEINGVLAEWGSPRRVPGGRAMSLVIRSAVPRRRRPRSRPSSESFAMYERLAHEVEASESDSQPHVLRKSPGVRRYR